MLMDSIDRRQPGAQQQEPDQLPCPRCDSTNTKFCYYNNYNLSQPRHFCKACRRYWTQGGTLRNIPVGGGSRKNSKRSRAAGSTPSPPASVVQVAMDQVSKQAEVSFADGGLIQTGAPGSFTSLLSTQGTGFLALAGLDEMGYVMGTGEWPYNEAVARTTGGGCSGWGLGGVDCGFLDGDCFTWPDLSISMPVKGFK